MKKLNPENVLRFHKLIKNDDKNGYNSWKHCYRAFGNINQDVSVLALHLGFYLASWGMYRGSTAISTKDYTIHIGAVEIIKKFYFLRCNENNEFKRDEIPVLLSLCKALRNHYYSFDYLVKDVPTKRKPTDTLISKIIIGTLGCSPAFDRYFNSGAREKGFKFYKISEKSFQQLYDFRVKYELELLDLQIKLKDIDQIHYPLFKIVDNYFWHEGFQAEQNKK